MAYPVDVRGVLEALAEQRVVTGEIDIATVELGDQTYTFPGPALFEVTLTNAGSAILGAGTVEATVRTECVRCLRDFDMTFSAEVEGFYVFPGKEVGLPEEQDFEFISDSLKIDLEPAVRQAIVVDLPFAPVHDPFCKGICPMCGADRNTEECGCEPEHAGSSFSALKGLLEPGTEGDEIA